MIKEIKEIESIFEKGCCNLEKSTSLYNSDNYKLDKIKNFLSFIGNPQNKFKVIHIAGSKGKGTTAHMIAAILENGGKKTGLFTSPHVYDFRERFQAANSFFKDKDYIEAANIFENYINSYSKSSELTTFERYLAYAIILFNITECEYVVLETGLGGRLDATNAINSFCQILTTIEKEHTKILGKTLRKIATEKSKIIKQNSFVFSMAKQKVVKEIFTSEAELNNSKIVFFDDIIKKVNTRSDKNGNKRISVVKNDGTKYDFMLSLCGKYFTKDAILAIECIRSLKILDDNLFEKSYKKMTEEIKIPARFQKINYKGLDFVLDGAHTPVSIKSTCKTFKDIYKGETTLIFGCADDKDIKTISKILVPLFDKIIITEPGTFKKSDTKKIFNTMKSNNNVTIIHEARDAIKAAIDYKSPTLVTGSFYLADKIFKSFL